MTWSKLDNCTSYKLQGILIHNTFPSATVFSFYIFTFVIFRKLNKPQLTKIKQQNFIGIHAFDSRLYLDISRFFKWKESFIFRYFKVFQVSQMFTCGLSDLLLLVVGSLVIFVLREYILKVHILVSSEHILCVGSFNMDWRILVFYPEPDARDNIS